MLQLLEAVPFEIASLESNSHLLVPLAYDSRRWEAWQPGSSTLAIKRRILPLNLKFGLARVAQLAWPIEL